MVGDVLTARVVPLQFLLAFCSVVGPLGACYVVATVSSCCERLTGKRLDRKDGA